MYKVRNHHLVALVLILAAVAYVSLHFVLARVAPGIDAGNGVAFPSPSSAAQARPRGYVLKHGEGEVLDEQALLIIKASPRSGTQGGVMVYDEMAKGDTSGVHYHLKADEIFYVIEGRGTMKIGDQEKAIETGDTIFVPVGEDHKITSSEDRPLKLVYFLDRPGLEQQFREELRLKIDRKKITLEEFNAMARKFGTVYKSLE